ncbi:MAG: ECF transporter S component, partial [Candidatus Bathyarchaeia archaeon]
MKAIKVIASAVCGVLYGAVGYMIYSFAPITTPGVGVVRFWPSVVIPAVFAVLFGPLVGGLGAAIGIFLSDMAIHGDPLLSLSAGVTSNFIGFYLVGYISRRSLDWAKTLAITSIVLLSTLPVLEYILLTHVSLEAAILFIGLLIASYILMVVIGQ